MPGQDQAGLHPVEEVVVVPGPPVVGDQLFASICHPKECRGPCSSRRFRLTIHLLLGELQTRSKACQDCGAS